jgi:acyl-CoA synthetase (NDP forming)
MQLLHDHGIPSPVFETPRSEDEVAAACDRIGYPLVMKVISPQIIHKSDVGGVMLNITRADEGLRAFEKLREIAKDKEFKGVIIYPMVRFDSEVIMGLTRDINFGPVVAFGLGGIYTEVFKDLVFRVAPIDTDTAAEMIRSIKSFPILAGSRGKKPADIEKLAGILSNFSYLPFKHPEIIEADINPLSVSGETIYALDARIITAR